MTGLCLFKTWLSQFLTATLVLLTISVSAQWSWVNPLPQGNTLHDVQFVNVTTGFAVGDGGTILKTTNGGYTWSRMESGTMESLNSTFFLDSLTGYAISNEGPSLYKTTDGGISWSLAYLFDTFQMNDVWFTDPLHGVAIGYEAVFVTSDGGIHWSWNAPYSWNFSVWYSDASTAFMSSQSDLYKSYDGGNTWTIKQSNVNGWRGSLFFMNADTGFQVGGGGQIYRTTDEGEHWDTIHSSTSNVLSAAWVFPNGTGYTVGYAGTMLKTGNGGASWINLPPLTDYNLETITFSNASHGVITGESGLILITEDGGLTWTFISSSITKKNLYAISFPDQNTGYAAGADATVLKSVNGGDSWQQLSIPGWNNLYSLFFTDSQTGYVAGANGTIIKTSDGGGSWNNLNTGVTYDLRYLVFPDNQTGYAIGLNPGVSDSTYLLKTNNAGSTWTAKPIDYGYNSGMVFTSADTGFIAGHDGYIKKTTDGGNSWIQQGPFLCDYFYDICFPGKNTGFACGYHAIYRTMDGGIHWDILYAGPLSFIRMMFSDPLNGYALASGVYTGQWILFKTVDGGISWGEQSVNLTTYGLNDLFFKDTDTGFIVGNNGVILKTTNGGGIITGYKPGPVAVASAIALFPNPCTNRFEIQLPELQNHIDLIIYSLLGQEVFFAEFTQAQILDIALPSLPAGTYLVKIKTDSTVIVKKLIVKNS